MLDTTGMAFFCFKPTIMSKLKPVLLSIKHFFDLCANGIGFDNVSDFMTSILNIKYPTVSLVTFIFGFILSVLNSTLSLINIFEEYAYSPVWGYIIFVVGIILESFLGTRANIKVEGEKYDPDKGLRIVPKIIIQSIFLFQAYNMGKVEPLLSWLPSTIWIWITTMNFLKGIRSAAKLKWVDGDLARTIESKLSSNNGIKKDGNGKV